MNKLLPLLLLGSLGAPDALAQSLTKPETALITTVTKQLPETMGFLEKVVNINSGTLNKAGVRQVGDLMGDELKKLGFTIEWVPLPDSLNRAGHLVATRTGKRGKKLFLIGHLDTVFEKSLPMEPYTRVNDTTATGQGVNDMKGGDVLIIAALKAMHTQKLLDDTSITIYMTGDEESSGGPESRRDFIERARKNDVALAFEGAQGLSNVTTGRRGSSGWTLTVKARTGHSSRIFSDLGYGAIYEAARVLTEFRRQLGQEQYLTFNPGLIVGGSEVQYDDKTARAQTIGKTNIVAGSALVKGDLRFLGEAQKEKPAPGCVRSSRRVCRSPARKSHSPMVFRRWTRRPPTTNSGRTSTTSAGLWGWGRSGPSIPVAGARVTYHSWPRLCPVSMGWVHRVKARIASKKR